MRGGRRQARELALQLLFQVEVTRDPPVEVAARFFAAHPAPEESRTFAEVLAFGALEHMAEIDAAVAAAGPHWRPERMALVDRSVLRLAVFELLWHRDTPPAVVINEAIEVGRSYGSEDSAGFINGVLDAVRRGIESDPPRP